MSEIVEVEAEPLGPQYVYIVLNRFGSAAWYPLVPYPQTEEGARQCRVQNATEMRILRVKVPE